MRLSVLINSYYKKGNGCDEGCNINNHHASIRLVVQKDLQSNDIQQG